MDPSINLNADPSAIRKSPLEHMQEARIFFTQNFGLSFDEAAKLREEPSAEQLDRLRAWREETFVDSIDMPNEDTFYKKVFLAQALMPQKDEQGNIVYLFGKGVGAELCLQGEVAGREKKGIEVPYRTHADFEIYAADPDIYKTPAGQPFSKVFGGQEYYPKTATKGLSKLPETMLTDTAEEVNLGGMSLLVPNLELQFVDKFMKGNAAVEQSLRGKTDAEWLASTFTLDSGKVDQLLDDYVIAPGKEEWEAAHGDADALLQVLQKKRQNAQRLLESDGEEVTPHKLFTSWALSNYLTNQGIDPSELAAMVPEQYGEYVTAAVDRHRQQNLADLAQLHQKAAAVLHT